MASNKEKIPMVKGLIISNVYSLPNTMKTGLWGTGKGYFGMMRQRSSGLGQVGRCIFGRNEVNHYQTRPPHQLLSTETGIT